MALIGRNTVTGNFIKCSNLTPDGSTTTFTLTNSTTGDNVYPGNQNSLIVSVSGVIQNPGTAYTINNNQITFTTAPSISDTIDFIVIMGDLVAIGTPSDDTVDTVHIKDGAVHNTKLQNSAITINGTSINLGASGTIVAGTDWQTVITADGSTATTAVAGEGYFIDNSSATHTINLPSSPSLGDTVSIISLGDAGVNNITVGRNGSNIQGSASDYIINSNNQSDVFIYSNASEGWVIQTTTSEVPTYVTATGGTVTEDGDYKVHTFTGDGSFVVSTVGNSSGSSTVDYLVVAAGGGGGSCNGGGGGGGSVITASSDDVTATTYPISIGAGGSGGSGSGVPANKGNNTTFFGITSISGGGGFTSGNTACAPAGPYGNGGAGAGVADSVPGSIVGQSGTASSPIPAAATNFGANSGGNGTNGDCGVFRSGGGGGAGGNGNPGLPGPTSSQGGAGTPSSICGTNYYYGAGGGGGVYCGVGGTGGIGGSGGGGGGPSGPGVAGAAGSSGRNAGTAGQPFPTGGEGGPAGANTGSGGGGGGRSSPSLAGGNGGSGIVIIRYKFQ